MQDEEKRKEAEISKLTAIYGNKGMQVFRDKEEKRREQLQLLEPVSPEKGATDGSKSVLSTKKIKEKKLLKDLSTPNIKILDGQI